MDTDAFDARPAKRQKVDEDDDANIMWVEKYRPVKLKDLSGQKNIIDTIGRLVEQCKLPHLLFYGPPGTGKTTTMLAVARQINGKHWRSLTLELNASDERGIDVIRHKVKSFASTKAVFGSGFKIVILDESDSMTRTAQFAMRRVIEEYAKTTRFCMICNYVNKIIPALQSRCTKFRFAPLERNDIVARLRMVASTEKVNMTGEGLSALIKLAEGDMRKCLNVMQSAHMAYPEVNEEAVHLCTGAPLPKDITQVCSWLLNSSFKEAYDNIAKLQHDKSYALVDLLQGLHPLVLKVKFPPTVFCGLLSGMADVENRLSVATNPRIQLAGLVGVFQKARNDTFELQRGGR